MVMKKDSRGGVDMPGLKVFIYLASFVLLVLGLILYSGYKDRGEELNLVEKAIIEAEGGKQ